MIKFECAHADTCLPAYWCGHHLPYVSIPVYRGMKLKDIKDALHSEVNAGAIAGQVHKELAYNDYELNDKGHKLFHAAINRIKPSVKGQRTFFKGLEDQDEDADFSVYAYFVFVDNE